MPQDIIHHPDFLRGVLVALGACVLVWAIGAYVMREVLCIRTIVAELRRIRSAVEKWQPGK